jgi:transcriptional regulator with XRE-family HTH domain
MTARELILLGWMREQLASGRAREVRERARISQSEVARLLGVKPNAVSRWETGERRPRGTTGVRYAKLLERLSEER